MAITDTLAQGLKSAMDAFGLGLTPAFYFAVKVMGMPFEASFTEVSGLGYTIETELLEEGGVENPHEVFKSIKYDDVVLKRAMAPIASLLTAWSIKTSLASKNEFITPLPVQINLINSLGLPARTWMIKRAYPIKWSADSFNSMDNKLAFETITLKHSGFTRIL